MERKGQDLNKHFSFVWSGTCKGLGEVTVGRKQTAPMHSPLPALPPTLLSHTYFPVVELNVVTLIVSLRTKAKVSSDHATEGEVDQVPLPHGQGCVSPVGTLVGLCHQTPQALSSLDTEWDPRGDP